MTHASARPATRRIVLQLGVAGGAALLLGGTARAADAPPSPVPGASTETLEQAIGAFTGGAAVKQGRVKLDIAPLVENGNTVPITVSVESPMSDADHVAAITVLNEKNPQRDVITCRLGPRAGRATVASRIRLATSQTLVAIAQMNDGSFWSDRVDVIVTLAACIETP